MTTDRLFLFSALFALLLSLGCAASDDDDHPPPSANDDDATSDDDDDADNDTDDDAPTIEVLGDFPRPDFVREDHLSLEGAWDFAFDPENVGLDEAWFANPDFAQTIVVPYCVESEASGVAENDPPAVMWYARSFAYEKSAEERALMHFGAVDYHAMMWLNGEYIGEHFGGYTPFSFDVTDLLEDDNVLVVRVEDRNDGTRPRGKQALFGEPYAIWYETVSGIWQPVWIERAGRAYVERYRVEPDFATGDVAVRVRLAGDAAAATVRVEAIAPDGARASAERLAAGGEIALTLRFASLAAWSPGEPNLYALAITVTAGGSADAVRGYFGARSIETRTGEVLLNGERLYQKLVLNQGYYPRGHYTPVDPAMYRNDVELIKALGFNGMRVHQKIESPRLLFFADYLGLLVWEEMPSAQYFTDDTMANIEREWREVIARDINHPSIIAWAPMNESWGAGAWPIPLIFRADANAFVEHLYALTKSLDPTRLVVDNSGYDHTDATDIVDVHHYLKNTELAADLYTQLADLWSYEYAIARPLRWLFDPGGTVQNVFTRWSSYHGQPVMISEYGGFGFYDTEGEETLLEKFGAYTGQIQAQPHLVGYGYTQFADTYQEANGLVDADRKPKAAIADIRAINDARR